MRFHSQLREVHSIAAYSLEQIQQLQVWGVEALHAVMHKHNAHTYLQANCQLLMHTNNTL